MPSRSLRALGRVVVSFVTGVRHQAFSLVCERLVRRDLAGPELGVDARHLLAVLLQRADVVELAGGVLEAQLEQRVLHLGELLHERGVVQAAVLRGLGHQSASSRAMKRALIGSFWMARSMASRASTGSG